MANVLFNKSNVPEHMQNSDQYDTILEFEALPIPRDKTFFSSSFNKEKDLALALETRRYWGVRSLETEFYESVYAMIQDEDKNHNLRIIFEDFKQFIPFVDQFKLLLNWKKAVEKKNLFKSIKDEDSESDRFETENYVSKEAVKFGDLDFLIFILERFGWDHRVCKNAIKYGHKQIFYYILENHKRFIDTMRLNESFLIDKNYPCFTFHSIIEALKRNDLELIKDFQRRGILYVESCIDAVKYSNLEMIKYFVSLGKPLTRTRCETLKVSPENYEYLLGQGWEPHHSNLSELIDSDNFELFEKVFNLMKVNMSENEFRSDFYYVFEQAVNSEKDKFIKFLEDSGFGHPFFTDYQPYNCESLKFLKRLVKEKEFEQDEIKSIFSYSTFENVKYILDNFCEDMNDEFLMNCISANEMDKYRDWDQEKLDNSYKCFEYVFMEKQIPVTEEAIINLLRKADKRSLELVLQSKHKIPKDVFSKAIDKKKYVFQYHINVWSWFLEQVEQDIDQSFYYKIFKFKSFKLFTWFCDKIDVSSDDPINTIIEGSKKEDKTFNLWNKDLKKYFDHLMLKGAPVKSDHLCKVLIYCPFYKHMFYSVNSKCLTVNTIFDMYADNFTKGEHLTSDISRIIVSEGTNWLFENKLQYMEQDDLQSIYVNFVKYLHKRGCPFDLKDIVVCDTRHLLTWYFKELNNPIPEKAVDYAIQTSNILYYEYLMSEGKKVSDDQIETILYLPINEEGSPYKSAKFLEYFLIEGKYIECNQERFERFIKNSKIHGKNTYIFFNVIIKRIIRFFLDEGCKFTQEISDTLVERKNDYYHQIFFDKYYTFDTKTSDMIIDNYVSYSNEDYNLRKLRYDLIKSLIESGHEFSCDGYIRIIRDIGGKLISNIDFKHFKEKTNFIKVVPDILRVFIDFNKLADVEMLYNEYFAKFAEEGKVLWDEDTAVSAATIGSVQILKFLHTKGCSYSTDILEISYCRMKKSKKHRDIFGYAKKKMFSKEEVDAVLNGLHSFGL